ncbi:MAG: multidrug effflux MFS transporter [Pseudomonadota bacterium]
MGSFEFVALIAMMFATIAFSIDAMLPALPQIAADLSPEYENRVGLILSVFLVGMGIGTFVSGPLSDAFGRRRVILFGAGLYIVAAGVAWASQSLEVMLLARFFQGLGVSGPRIVAVAIVRDLYAGREMARIVSIVMMIFTLVPAIAPLLGSLIIAEFGWRSIFLAFMLFAGVIICWMSLRLPETLPHDQRRPLRINLILSALQEIAAHPSVRISILVQSLSMAMLFTTVMMVQPIYFEVYDRAESFPYWFGVVAVLSGSASLINAALVGRYGMRRLVMVTLGLQILLSGAIVAFDLGAMAEPYGFGAFLVWQTFLFAQAGLTLGNLNAIAMEPMGHIAGMAASVVSAVSTVLAACIASPVGFLFNGTITPLISAVLVMALIGLALMFFLVRIEAQTARD